MIENIIPKAYQLMKTKMQDSAHDKEHIHRVLNLALYIAQKEETHTDTLHIDRPLLTVACLLHDIGRGAEYQNPNVCHAKEGSCMAYEFLQSCGVSEKESAHVAQCIASHRYKNSIQPNSIEAKILSDADNLDVMGAIGLARTLYYEGYKGIPLYHTNEDGKLDEFSKFDSFFYEYHHKLRNLDRKLYTKTAQKIGSKRQKIQKEYYYSLLEEIQGTNRGLLYTPALAQRLSFLI